MPQVQNETAESATTVEGETQIQEGDRESQRLLFDLDSAS